MVGVSFSLLTILGITALIHALQPGLLGMIILITTNLLAQKRSHLKVVSFMVLLLFAMIMTNFLIGWGLATFYALLVPQAIIYLSIGLALVLVFAGVLGIKDFFWYEEGVSHRLPESAVRFIHRASKKASVFGMFFLGSVISVIHIVFSSLLYISILSLPSIHATNSRMSVLWFYNGVFILLIVISLAILIFGKNPSRFKRWQQHTRGGFRLIGGMLMIALAWLLLLSATGTIYFG